MTKHRFLIATAGALLLAMISGCACRPGFVGPYGGYHPGQCWVW